ncbi:apolipoprotein C-II isoform X1 [Oryctolagus cuniculus]|uniref:apolipoprotein C-II isoform X1 n=1 Tax=Oryctolagus cuniculus TaxID=9986 RepID=UPI00048DA76C|nr:apolipoprotein C-II isoform X1 [Oryctolagus cuniculus]
MGPRLLLAVCLILLVLGCGELVQGSHLPQNDEPASPALLTKVQESLSSYWDSAKAAAQGLYNNTYLTAVDEKIRDMYSKSTAAMTTYASIVTDQLLTLLKGDP